MLPLILTISSLAIIATNSETIPNPKTNTECITPSSSCAPICGISTAKISPETSRRTKRLVGKTRKALLGSWPWMAALYTNYPGTSNKTRFACGATLISSEWILTAANCVPSRNNITTYVRLGDLDLDENAEDGATPIEVNITQIIKHPQFSLRPAVINNIALLRLSKPVAYTEHIRPICVRGGEEKYLNESYYGRKVAVILGWGRTSPGGNMSTHLREVEVNVVPSAKCARNYAKFDVSGEVRVNGTTMICANTNDGNDSCQGDSGGPLMFQDNEVWWIGGITSFGKDCGLPEYPGVYTKVPAYIDWINTSTGLKF